MKQILPSIIAKNQEEFNSRFEKTKSSSLIHLDVMDGKFVKNNSLNFDLALPRKKYQVHLMVKDPQSFIPLVIEKSHTIIFHIESFKDDKKAIDTINFIKNKKKKVGIAINPETPVRRIIPFLNSVDLVLIMTVTPGKYGSKFIPSSVKKSEEIRKINKKIKIGFDGGINNKTIKKIKSRADFAIVGSYLQNSDNPKQTIKELKAN